MHVLIVMALSRSSSITRTCLIALPNLSPTLEGSVFLATTFSECDMTEGTVEFGSVEIRFL